MTDINTLFFELIRVAIGNQACLSHTPRSGEWGELYAMAKKQSLVGICFAGVQKLQRQCQCPPEALYLQWMGMAAKIQQRNYVVNRRCVELQKKIETGRGRTYIMKGQGNAALYPKHLQYLRQPGDIDIYLEGGLDKVLAYAKTFGEVTKVNELEMSVPVFRSTDSEQVSDTEVEFHYRPFIMRNPFKNARLQKYFCECMDRKFSDSLILDDKKSLSINVPSIEFILVHQMVHIYHHLFTEGIGLRQLMDYYFLVRTQINDGLQINDGVTRIIHELGLCRFASALMWVVAHVFINENEEAKETWLPWEPNEKDGRVLLNEIMQSGNFGKQDERMEGLYDSKWNAFWMVNMKTFRFWRFDHWAWFWSPLWRGCHYIWRKAKGFV